MNEQPLTPQDYNQLVLRLNEMIKGCEQIADPSFKEQIFDLLKALDVMHREALRRIIVVIENHAPQIIPLLTQDAVIETILLLYEFMPQPAPEPPPLPSSASSFIPLSHVKLNPLLKKPIWLAVGKKADFPAGELVSRRLENENILLCALDDRLYAMRNACLDSVLPLNVGGKLDGEVVICPWHGCRYDVRTGQIQNGSGLKLETFPVQINEKGEVRIGFNIQEWN